MSVVKLDIGTRVWVRELSKNVQFNGLEGVVCAQGDGMSSERVLVKLDEEATELYVKRGNLMPQTSVPVYSKESPKFMDPSHRIVSSHEYVSIVLE